LFGREQRYVPLVVWVILIFIGAGAKIWVRHATKEVARRNGD
jgi:hypothetical protein